MDSMFVRVLLRTVQENALILGGATVAIVLLLIGVFVYRRIKKNKATGDTQAGGTDAVSRPFEAGMSADLAAMGDKTEMPSIGDDVIIDDDIDEPLPDDGDSIAAFEINAGHAAPEEVQALENQEDALMSSMMPDFDEEAHGQFNDMDEISIPRLGEAPEPKKHGFFSASWLHRNRSGEDDKQEADPLARVMAPQAAQIENAAPPASAANQDTVREMEEAAHMAHLADIERKMLALRELYEAGLIAPEVYVLKAREFAQSV